MTHTLAGSGVQHEVSIRTPVTGPSVDPGLTVLTVTLSGDRVTGLVRIYHSVLVTVTRLTAACHEVEETRLKRCDHVTNLGNKIHN